MIDLVLPSIDLEGRQTDLDDDSIDLAGQLTDLTSHWSDPASPAIGLDR